MGRHVPSIDYHMIRVWSESGLGSARTSACGNSVRSFDELKNLSRRESKWGCAELRHEEKQPDGPISCNQPAAMQAQNCSDLGSIPSKSFGQSVDSRVSLKFPPKSRGTPGKVSTTFKISAHNSSQSGGEVGP